MGVGRFGVEGLSKMEKGLMEMDNRVLIVGITGINGNGEKSK